MSENVLPYVPEKARIAKKWNTRCCLKKFAKKPDYQEMPDLTGYFSLA
jgi:hypothetical protein